MEEEKKKMIKQTNLTIEFQRRIMDGEEVRKVAEDLGINLIYPL